MLEILLMPVQSFDDDAAETQHDTAAVHLVVLTGDVDIARLDELADLVDTFRHSQVPNVDVDLTQVDFLDSTGLGAIFRLRGIASARGGRIRLLGPSRSVRRALELAGTTDLIEVSDG
jgi:anti-sigma B factor antagonist